MKKNGYGVRTVRAVLVSVMITMLLTACGRQKNTELETAAGESVSAAGISRNEAEQETISKEVSTQLQEDTSVQMFSFKDVYGQVYEVALNEEAALHSYDMEYLRSDGFFKSYHAPGYTSRVGVDVSKFQGEIEWEKVKAQGIGFAFIRVGNRGYGQEGTLNTDNMYLQNIEGAKAAGIDVGVYFYSQAVNEEEAVEEAEYLLQLIDGIELD